MAARGQRKSIEAIRRYAFGRLTCVNCGQTKDYTAVHNETKKPVDVTIASPRRFAREDDWRKNPRGQFVCPDCGKKLGYPQLTEADDYGKKHHERYKKYLPW